MKPDLSPQEARTGRPEQTGRCWYCWGPVGIAPITKRGREYCSDACSRREPQPGDEKAS